MRAVLARIDSYRLVDPILEPAPLMLASVLLAGIVGRIVDHADERTRIDHVGPVEVPAAWLDELGDH